MPFAFVFSSAVFCVFGMAGYSVSNVESKLDSGYGKGGAGASPGVGAVDVWVLVNILLQERGPFIDRVEVFGN